MENPDPKHELKLLTALPQLLKQTAAATPMYPKLAAHVGHCASTAGP